MTEEVLSKKVSEISSEKKTQEIFPGDLVTFIHRVNQPNEVVTLVDPNILGLVIETIPCDQCNSEDNCLALSIQWCDRNMFEYGINYTRKYLCSRFPLTGAQQSTVRFKVVNRAIRADEQRGD
jgi:hypothetical protein